MLRVDPVAWLEGAYVSPQHFQQQERYYTNYISRFFYLQHPGEFGFCQLSIAIDLLRIGKLAIRQAEGVFSDMTPFVLNKQLVIDIPEGYQDGLIYLVMPLSHPGDQEVGADDTESKRFRYRLDREELIDNTNPNNPSVKVSVARPQISLMLGGRDLSAYAYLPVTRVRMVDSNGGVELDPYFIPPILNIHVSDRINIWLQDYYSRITQRALILNRRMSAGRTYKSPHALYQDQLWLMALGQWQTTIGAMHIMRHVTPRDFYMALQAMAGTFAGLTLIPPPSPEELNPYKLSDVMKPLMDYLSECIQGTGAEWVAELPALDKELTKSGLLEYELPPSVGKCRLVFAIPESVENELDEDVTAYLTLAPANMIRQLIYNAEPGIPLSRPPLPPVELSLVEYLFLEPDRSSPLYQQALREKSHLSLHLDEKFGHSPIRAFLIRHQ